MIHARLGQGHVNRFRDSNSARFSYVGYEEEPLSSLGANLNFWAPREARPLLPLTPALSPGRGPGGGETTRAKPGLLQKWVAPPPRRSPFPILTTASPVPKQWG